MEAENAVALASAHKNVEGLVRKIALLEGELAAEHRAREVSERECREQFEELTLLQTRGPELCHAIIDPPCARHHQSEGMWHVALDHTEMVGEFTIIQATVSSTAESALGCSSNDTFCVEVVGELVAEF
jgi:hypothetical protein